MSRARCCTASQWIAAILVAGSALLMSKSAAAEVLDKVIPPWNAYFLVPTAVLLIVCAAMAASPWPWARITAIGIGFVWAVFRLSTDEWFSADVGSHLRVELSPAEGTLWFCLLVTEALLPAAAAIVFRIVPKPGKQNGR